MLISILIGIALLFFSLGLYRYSKDFLHPAIVFVGVWGGVLIVIGIAAPFGYYQIAANAFLVFFVGIFSFVGGASIYGRARKYPNYVVKHNLDFKKIVWFCVLLHGAILPLTLSEINEIGGGAGDVFALAYRLRAASVSREESVGILVGNYLTSGLFFAPILMIGWLEKKVRIWVFVALCLPWIVFNLLIGGRSGLIILIFTMVYIYISLKSNINIKFIVFAALFFALILISGNLLVGKIDAKVEDGFWSVFEQSVKSFFDYLLQGPILFSEYMENENLFNPTWDALIFNCQVLAKVNLCELPLLHQEFSYISYNGGVGNVYSVFYSIYPKYGWLGLVSIMGLYGIWAGYHHRRRYESIFNLLMAGFLFSAIILSVFSDTFGPSIYFFLKIFLIGLVVSLVLKKTKNSRVNTGC